jgi:hypothetical protein
LLESPEGDELRFESQIRWKELVRGTADGKPDNTHNGKSSQPIGVLSIWAKREI